MAHSYYYDTETGFYYLQSRYYDPVIHRFINADGFATTDPTDAISYNMFAYCNNNPANWVDYSGNSGEAIAAWGGGMWWLTAVDGPFPIGDIIYFAGCLVCGVIDLINYIGVDNSVRLIADGSEAVKGLVDKAASTSGSSSPPPNDPRFRSYTSGNFRYNLQQLTGESGKGMQAHHVFPQNHAAQFKEIGINVHEPQYGAWVDRAHQSWSYAYDKAWTEFFSSYSNPTCSQAMAYARVLAREYGFTLNF